MTQTQPLESAYMYVIQVIKFQSYEIKRQHTKQMALFWSDINNLPPEGFWPNCLKEEKIRYNGLWHRHNYFCAMMLVSFNYLILAKFYCLMYSIIFQSYEIKIVQSKLQYFGLSINSLPHEGFWPNCLKKEEIIVQWPVTQTQLLFCY